MNNLYPDVSIVFFSLSLSLSLPMKSKGFERFDNRRAVYSTKLTDYYVFGTSHALISKA